MDTYNHVGLHMIHTDQPRGRARRLRSSRYERSRKKESDWTEKVILRCSVGHNSLFVLNIIVLSMHRAQMLLLQAIHFALIWHILLHKIHSKCRYILLCDNTACKNKYTHKICVMIMKK